MKNKIINVVFKKFQSYSFIIFLILVLGAFFALSQLNNDNKTDDPLPANNTDEDDDDDDEPGDTNDASDEVFRLPLSSDQAVVVRDYYDPAGTKEEQISSIINVDNYYFMNKGINYGKDDGTEFDVLATLSGTVTKVKQDSLVGYLVEVEHLYNIKTVYHSLANVNVTVGDELAQGDVIGTAGESNFDLESGIHVHYEVLNRARKVDPNELIGTEINQFDAS